MIVLQSILLSIGIDTLAYMKDMIESYLSNDESIFEGTKIIKINIQETFKSRLDELGIQFCPPLHIQRYMVVQEILKHPIWNGSIKKVVAFGCGELQFFKSIKHVPGLNKVILVDKDSEKLKMNQIRVLPTTSDYSLKNERNEPMIVDIYNGNIAELDDRMLGVDVVVCIELIEHLNTDMNAVPNTVFEFIKPMLAVFTTPNAEFNILFPSFNTQFRHNNHRFEWTRKQFNKWVKNIISKYPDYAVQIEGLGVDPIGTKNLGCCSQMAIFYRKDMKTSPANPIGSRPYKLKTRVSYPFKCSDEIRIREDSICSRLEDLILEISSEKIYIVDGSLEIPIDIITPYVIDCCSSIEELESTICKFYYTKVNAQAEWVIIKCMSEVDSDEYKSYFDTLNNSEQDFSLEDDLGNTDNDKEDLDAMGEEEMSIEESKFSDCTPMTKNQEYNTMDSIDTVFSDLDLYTTVNDYNESEHLEKDISSSCNNSLVVENCEVYQEFLTGRNNSTIHEEEISKTEGTSTYVANSHAFYNDSYNANNSIIDDNIVLQNSSNCNDTAQKLESENNDDFLNEPIDITNGSQSYECFNRTLLDESGYTEQLLSTQDKEL